MIENRQTRDMLIQICQIKYIVSIYPPKDEDCSTSGSYSRLSAKRSPLDYHI